MHSGAHVAGRLGTAQRTGALAARERFSPTSAATASTAVSASYATARLMFCRAVERDAGLHGGHDRKRERHHLQGQLVDAGAESDDEQRWSWQRSAVDRPRQLSTRT